MGRDRYGIIDRSAPHFVTCTVLQWLPLFAHRTNAQVLLDALQHLQDEAGLKLYGYVILENHCHLLARSPDLGKALSSFKSYTAAEIIKQLQARGSRLLDWLALHKTPHKTGCEHQVWQEGSHPEMIEGELMMLQKLEYIHDTPVQRGYVDDPVHWRYSSARNYAGQPGLISVVTDW
jgi:putative transposase